MRLAKHKIEQRINSDLKIEFAKQDLSSFSGLELVQRYFRLINLNIRIRQAFQGHGLTGDYSVVHMVLVMVALWLTGGRRLRHIAFISEDPLVKRLSGLKTLPSDRSVSRWLGQFTNDALQCLVALNSDIVSEKLKAENLARITLDFDGTVLSCGDHVKWAARGYNPQNRHAKSLYPLLCHIAQTGHFFRVLNRSGDRHDSNRALGMIKACVEDIRKILPGVIIEVRLDAAFFQEPIIKYLLKANVEFAIKVPMWSWLNLKETIILRQRWTHLNKKLSSFKMHVGIDSWGIDVPLTFYRKKISDSEPKNPHQLDFFTPDDGVYEHFVILSNKDVKADTLQDFYNGRCSMEHDIAELKGEFGFDVIPCRDYQGNGAHQQISTLAFNLIRNFQIDALGAPERERTASRTNIFSFESLKTIRFEMIAVAGRIVNSSGQKILRLTHSVRRKDHYQKIERQLDKLHAEKRAA